jgi:hypothetical protein
VSALIKLKKPDSPGKSQPLIEFITVMSWLS